MTLCVWGVSSGGTRGCGVRSPCKEKRVTPHTEWEISSLSRQTKSQRSDLGRHTLFALGARVLGDTTHGRSLLAHHLG